MSAASAAKVGTSFTPSPTINPDKRPLMRGGRAVFKPAVVTIWRLSMVSLGSISARANHAADANVAASSYRHLTWLPGIRRVTFVQDAISYLHDDLAMRCSLFRSADPAKYSRDNRHKPENLNGKTAVLLVKERRNWHQTLVTCFKAQVLTRLLRLTRPPWTSQTEQTNQPGSSHLAVPSQSHPSRAKCTNLTYNQHSVLFCNEQSSLVGTKPWLLSIL